MNIIDVENNDKSKKINISFFILLLLFIQVIMSDIIIYFIGIKYIIAQIIAFVINIVINYFMIKKKVIKIKKDFEKWDLIFISLFIVISILTIIYPDEFYDSFSYHIYLQKNAFSDKINDDFFPGRTLTTYTYPLVDRLYMLFRSRLGFRLGVLPSYLIMIVMFYQIKKIFKKLLDKKYHGAITSILSIVPMCAFIILQQYGTYYIDNICISLLLEFIYIVLFENNLLFKEKSKLYFLIFLMGILVSAKFTNAFYLIVPFMYLLIKNIKDIKNIKWYDYLLIIIIGFLPMFVYMYDAIKDTGSPVFPYYNSIFKSEYFGDYNWFDSAYGANNLFEILMWPLLITKFPNRGYNLHETDFNFAYGYIASISYLVYFITYKFIYRKLIKKEKIEFNLNFMLSVLILYLNIVLAKFCIGYTRYGGIISVISGIFIIKLFFEFFEKKNALLTILLGYAICSSALIGMKNFMDSGKMTYYKGFFTNTQSVVERAMLNGSCLFKDQDYMKYDIDGIWGVIGDESALPSMLRVDDPIVQLRDGVFVGETEKSQKIYFDKILNNDIYVPIHELKVDLQLRQLDSNNFEIEEIADVLPNAMYLLDARSITIVKVKYNENREKSNLEIYNKLLLERVSNINQ